MLLRVDEVVVAGLTFRSTQSEIT